jgi:uncharacterized YccA/Bax inhibitor family protein
MLVEQRTLKSSNPILRRQRLMRQGGRKTAARDPLFGLAVARERIGAGNDQAYGAEPVPVPYLAADLMTMNDVLARTALVLGLAVLTAVLSWTVPVLAPTNIGRSYGIAGGACLVAFVLVLVQYRRSRPSPALTLTYAAVEGLFLGVFSSTVSTHITPGLFVQTVMGTMAVFAGVLVAFKLRWIRVTRRISGFALAALLGLFLLAGADLLLSPLAGADDLGIGNLAVGACLGGAGIVLGVFVLALHFRQVEDDITHGAPREQSWLAAFGLTLTLVWLYVETVRLLTLVSEDDLY